jgi:hypothetical protein
VKALGYSQSQSQALPEGFSLLWERVNYDPVDLRRIYTGVPDGGIRRAEED